MFPLLSVCLVSSLVICTVGCNESASEGPHVANTQDERAADETNESNANATESVAIEVHAAKPEAPQADAKPAEPPLDENVRVDELLAARLTADQLGLGWIRLFDGQSLLGWTRQGNVDWRVEDGCIVATKGDSNLLCTSVRFSDFELELEYKGAASTNSGVFLRTAATPKDPAADCYELNIAPPDNPFPTGSLVGRIKANEQIDEPEPGEWHTLHALVDRDHIQAWVDGVQSADYVDTTGLTAGLIGLQFREGEIRFRNVRVRPLAYSVLPTVDHKDWNEPKGETKAEFTSSGSLILRGGKGHIELLQPHANCAIQVQAKTLAPNVNSGVFFRCIPGEDMNGYECQINHGFKEDRRRPVDAGTGAIFRRQAARAVLSDEDQTAFVTIIADGPRFSTWVNGVQVVEWEDTRAPNDNPRKGLRLESGTIMLQGHDPTCEVQFDSLAICPLP